MMKIKQFKNKEKVIKINKKYYYNQIQFLKEI